MPVKVVEDQPRPTLDQQITITHNRVVGRAETIALRREQGKGTCVTVGYMRDEPSSVQRSFRLSPRTIDLLDAAASAGGESRNALADRLLGEALRLQRHPLIRFQLGAAGRRQPLVVGTRLYVHQVMSAIRTSHGDIDQVAEYLGVSPRLVRAAVDYYAEFSGEVDEDAAIAEHVEQSELDRWERQQRALA
jgi:uncharacterized protein (DUF433 family)